MHWTKHVVLCGVVCALASVASAQPAGATRERAISMPSGEGSITGMGDSFSADIRSGAATYSVPIALPPGRAGVSGSLSLGYSSTAGNSSAGIGWSVPGTAITRSTDGQVPRYRDRPRWHPEEDRFAFNGAELVPLSDDAAAAFDGVSAPAEFAGYQQYRSEIEGAFYRFFRAPDFSRWVVQTPDGSRLEFGRLLAGDGPSDLSSTSALQTGPSGNVYGWHLTRESDTHGSAVYYSYRTSDTATYLADIYYLSPNSCAASSPSSTRACRAPLTQYGVRVHLVYEPRGDAASSYRSGFAILSAERLRRIEITSADGEPGARFLVRRYHLRYRTGSYHSLLASVQLEGRPETQDASAGVMVGNARLAESSLGEAIVGPLLPPLTFHYTGEAALATGIEGFPHLEANVKVAGQSPRYGVSDPDTELVDVNADGLPDVLVTDALRYPGSDGKAAAGVYFNGFRGTDAQPSTPGTFSEAVRVPFPSNEAAASMRLSNPAVASMDVRGDGIEDVVRLPSLTGYGYLATARAPGKLVPSPSPVAQGFRLAHVPVQVPSGEQTGAIDFTSEPTRLRYIDVDGDGRFDILRTSGNKLQFWRNLSSFEGGTARFGSAQHDGTRWVLSSAPFETCVPYDVSAVDFRSPLVQLADMNGDGRLDIVRRSSQRVVYWPASEYGRYGTAQGHCDFGTLRDAQVVMSNLASGFDATADNVLMADMDGDGRADLVRIVTDRLDVYFNKAGAGFSAVASTRGLPDASDLGKRVRLMDMDGSGTTDIVFGDGRNYQWVDPLGGYRHRLLNQVDGGLGALTTLEYGSSVDDYLRDLAATNNCHDESCDRFTWADTSESCDEQLSALLGSCVQRPSGSRMFTSVVRAVEVSDRLSALGAASVPTRTEYAYHDAYYDGAERELRGFRITDVRSVGDDPAHTLTTRTTMHQGRRPNELAVRVWITNPNAVLKGLPFHVEQMNGQGRYLATTHKSFAVRRLLTGLDKRDIYHAIVARVDRLPYSQAGDAQSAGGVVLASDGFIGVTRQVYDSASGSFQTDTAWPGVPETVVVRDKRYAHTLETSDDIDRFGHALLVTAHGRIRGEFGEPLPDERIVQRSTWSLENPAIWLFKKRRTATEGHGTAVPLADTEFHWDANTGDLTTQIVHVSLPQAFEFAGDEDGALGFVQRAEDMVTSRKSDAWGNHLVLCEGGDVNSGASGCLRYGETIFDQAYGQNPVENTLYTDLSSKLVNHAVWDRGFGQLLRLTDANGHVSEAGFNGFGWPVFQRLPPADGCEGTSVPNSRTFYWLTNDPAARPLSFIESRMDVSCKGLDAETRVTRSFVDGLGRVRATLTRAEAPYVWVRSGVADYDRQGRVRASYQPDSIASPLPTLASVLATPSTPTTKTSYDPFGRVQCIRDAMGELSCTTYHALSRDFCDPLDQNPSSVAYGTCTTLRQDGHGRDIDRIVRNRRDGLSAVETTRLWTTFRADGIVLELTRAETSDDAPRSLSSVVGDHTLSRTFTYDSVGRRLASTDHDTDARRPTASAQNRGVRYLYNRVGDLVAFRDPRGCGSNAFFDMAGRRLGEQYVGCADAQRHERPSESLPAGAIALAPLDGAVSVDARTYWDFYPSWAKGELAPGNDMSMLGQITALLDRGQRSALTRDARGTVVRSAKQLALIPAALNVASSALPGSQPVADDGAVEAGATLAFDEEHTYVRYDQFDHAGQARKLLLPSDPDFGGGTAPQVGGDITYNTRGLATTTTLSVDAATYPIISSVKYSVDGLSDEITFGDGLGGRAPTRSYTQRDALRRPTHLWTVRAPTADAVDGPSLGAVTVVEDQSLRWDAANSLLGIDDGRVAAEWPRGHRPQSVDIEHDALYRVNAVFYRYAGTDGVSPGRDDASDYRTTLEQLRAVDPMHRSAPPSVSSLPAERVASLTYDSDWLGNVVEIADDAHSFYERSLGHISNGLDEPGGRPSALRLASDLPETAPAALGNQAAGGYVEVDYGEGGLVSAVTVHGQCADNIARQKACWDDVTLGLDARRAYLATACVCTVEQRYEYRWDELARVADARRYDHDGDSWELAAHMRFRYDGENHRTLKEVTDEHGDARIALYVFGDDFERRGLLRGLEDRYEADADTETQYLVGGARVVWQAGASLLTLDADHRITLPISDLIKSTSAVLELRSGELVESATYYPTGSQETLLARSDAPVPLEPKGFTGKEADEEVGLTYFGERYLLSRLGRWASPDPLQVHEEGGGESLNNYHYIGGSLLQARDPIGLCPSWDKLCPFEKLPDHAVQPDQMCGGKRCVTDAEIYAPIFVEPEPKGSFEDRFNNNRLKCTSCVNTPDSYWSWGRENHIFASWEYDAFNAMYAEARGQRMAAAKAEGETDHYNAWIAQGESNEAFVNSWGLGVYVGASALGYSHKDAQAAGEWFNTALSVIQTGHLAIQSGRWAASGGGGASTGGGHTAGPCEEGGCGGDGTCFVAGTPVHIDDHFVPIERVEIGSRARTIHEQRCTDHPIDHSRDRIVSLRMLNPDGSGDVLEIRLARPRSWIESHGVRPGAHVFLNLEELGAGAGDVLVDDVTDMHAVENGPGCVVTGTITHLSNDVRRVFLSDREAPLEATDVHPLFSLDQQRFVQVAQLSAGERLRTATGETRIEHIEPRAGVVRVFNIEVEREHSYLVTELDIWSHNVCPRNLTDAELTDYVDRLAFRDKRTASGGARAGGTHGLKHRYREQVQGAGRPGTDAWDNHEQAFLQQQAALREALYEMDRRGLTPPPDAWKLATAPPPTGDQTNTAPTK